MIRPIRLVLEILFAVTLILAIPTGAFLLRLQKSDIQLQSFLPDIQDMLADVTPGLKYAIDEATLKAGEPEDLFLIHARGILLRNSDDQVVGSMQEMILGFSWRNLLHFSVIPSRVDVQRPSIQLTRFEDGRVGISLEANPTSKSKRSVPELSSMLAHAPGVLKKIQIHDAWVGFVDKKQDVTYEATKGLFDFNREGDKVSGTLSINIKGKDIDQPVRGTIDYDPKREATRFRTVINGLYLKQLTPFVTEIPDDVNLDMPIDLVVGATISPDFQFERVTLHLLGTKGTLTYPPYYPDPITLSDFSAALAYNISDGKMMLRDLSARLDKAMLHAQGEITTDKPDGDEPVNSHVTLTGLLESMPVNDLKIYWPHGLAHDVRDWVTTHLHEGTATRSGIEVELDMKPDKTTAIKKLGGKIEFSDVTTNYLPPMPEVKKVSGFAEFDPDNFNITFNSGTLFDTHISTGEVLLSKLREHTQHAQIDLVLEGPIADAVKAIESEPLQYPQRLGLGAGQFNGSAHTKLHLSFPLLKDLKLDQVQMKTVAQLKGAGVKNVIKDLSLSNADLDFEADTEQLKVSGKGNLADAPAEISWQESFGTTTEYTTVLHAKGAATAGLLKGLRLPVDQYIKGTAQAEADITQDQKKTARVSIVADLMGAEITIPELGVTKKQGTPGKLSLKMTSEKAGPTVLSDVNASWSQFQVNNGTIRWNNAMNLESATLNGFRSGRTAANISVTPQGNGVRAVINGDVVDLSGYWTKKQDPDQKPDNQIMDVSLRAKTFYLDPEVPLQNMKADILLQGSDLVRGTISAQAASNATLNLNQVQKKDGSRQLQAVINNAGQMLSALDITDSVRDGKLTINGQSAAKDPAALAGNIVIENFTMVKAPVLARLINAFSPGGLIELLNGRGLVFSRMKSGFALEKPKTIRLSDGKMAGASLGLNFGGRIYRDRQTLDLTGTIIPMEGLNKLVSGIPIIGQILTGIKGEGLIGATYKITGPTSDPNVSVNPLSVLTPGILRSIFFESKN